MAAPLHYPKTRGIIAAGNPAPAEAAAALLRAGGNAFDAAVAAFFATMVAEPCMNSPGGGGFMTAVPANGKPVVLDFFCQTPRKKLPADELEFYPVVIDFGTATESFHVGMGSIAVPGSLAGAYEMHRRYGRLPMAEVLHPAVDLARKGARVDDFQAHDILLLEPILKIPEAGRRIFFDANMQRIGEGDTIFMPGFADFLETLVNEGPDLFYKGEIAQRIVRDCRENGGMLTLEDFAEYRVIERTPLAIRYHGKTVLSNPRPGIGGSLMAIGLQRLAGKPTGFPVGSEGQLLALAEILSEMDRTHHDPAWMAAAMETGKRGNTTHLNVLDEFGNAVSITTSNGEGCGYIVPGTDFMMNNMLGEAALLPQGFHSWTENTRLSSMMAPTVVVDDKGKPEIVLGSGGAGRIPGAMMQVLRYLIDKGLHVKEAVEAPRAHWRGGTFNVETGFPRKFAAPQGMKNLVFWEKPDMYFGGVHTIVSRSGDWEAAGDSRRSGVVEIVN